ncbi:hypothetical protein SLE2022_194970 [Rubroshorea leprosula]
MNTHPWLPLSSSISSQTLPQNPNLFSSAASIQDFIFPSSFWVLIFKSKSKMGRRQNDPDRYPFTDLVLLLVGLIRSLCYSYATVSTVLNSSWNSKNSSFDYLEMVEMSGRRVRVSVGERLGIVVKWGSEFKSIPQSCCKNMCNGKDTRLALVVVPGCSSE